MPLPPIVVGAGGRRAHAGHVTNRVGERVAHCQAGTSMRQLQNDV
jgi:hypothetical protein